MTVASGRLIRAVPPTSSFVVYCRADLPQKRNDWTRHGRFRTRSTGLYIQAPHLADNELSDSATAPITDNTFSYPAPLDSTDHSRPANSAQTSPCLSAVWWEGCCLLQRPALTTRYRIQPKKKVELVN